MKLRSLGGEVAGKIVAVGLALVLVWWLAPMVTGADGDGISEAVSAAEELDELNSKLAESAPQQQVANGWATNNLLVVIAQSNASLSDDLARIQALLALILIALVWRGLAGGQPRKMTSNRTETVSFTDYDQSEGRHRLPPVELPPDEGSHS